VLINYTTRVKETGEVVDTTYESVAKEAKIYEEGRKYKPRLVALGKGWIFKDLEQALIGAQPGQKLTVELSPDKAFGAWDKSKVRTVPLRRFGDKAKDVKEGAIVEVDGQVGTVLAVNSGRVMIDFNDRLAGKTLVYEVEVVKEITEPVEKVTLLFQRRLDIENIKVTVDGGVATIEIPPEAFLAEGLQYIKRAAADDILGIVDGITQVKYVETYSKA